MAFLSVRRILTLSWKDFSVGMLQTDLMLVGRVSRKFWRTSSYASYFLPRSAMCVMNSDALQEDQLYVIIVEA